MSIPRVYLDHNATSPLRPEVIEYLASYMGSTYGNPNSIHGSGRKVRQLMDQSREWVATLAGCDPAEVIFTSGGTESNHLAWRAFQTEGQNIVTSSIEHSCVLAAAMEAKRRKARVHFLKASQSGAMVFEPGEPAHFISLQCANNETGVIHDLSSVPKHAAVFHTDAVQFFGKKPFHFKSSVFDMMSISGHKLGAPQGVGALIVRRKTAFESLWNGGPQERGRRPGTENVLGVLGLGMACKVLAEKVEAESSKIETLRDVFESELIKRIPDMVINGKDEARLPNTIHLTFERADGESLMIAADISGIDFSTGAACSSGSIEPSHVLLAMGFSEEQAKNSVRLSLGWNTTEKDVEKAVDCLPNIVKQVRDKKGYKP